MQVARSNRIVFRKSLVFAAIFLSALPYAGDLLAQSAAPQQNETEAVVLRLPSDWAVGDGYDLEYLRTKERFEENTRTSYDIVRTPIRIKVLEKDVQGYVLRWTFGESSFQAAPEDVRSLVSGISAHLLDNRHMDLRADTQGKVLGLRNLEDLLTGMKAGLAAAEIWLEKQEFPAAKTTRIRNRLARLATPEFINQLALKPPSLFLTVSGSDFELGKAADYDSVLASPFTGEPLPARGQILLQEFRPDEDWALIEVLEVPDPELLSQMMRRQVQAMAKSDNKKVPREQDLPQLMVLDEGHYEYDTARGWPRKVTMERQILAGKYRRVVRHQFTVLKPGEN